MPTGAASDYNSLSDEHLLRMVAKQDLHAYEVLYDKHAAAMFGLILRIVRDSTAAEELLQETFWQIWQNASQYEGTGAAAAWMFRIGRNRSLDELRRQKARPRSSEQVDIESAYRTTGANQPSAESEAETLLNRQQIQHALSALPEEQRVCLTLAYFEGLSHAQIGERLNLPMGTVKSRLRIGMEKLERSLRTAGFP